MARRTWLRLTAIFLLAGASGCGSQTFQGDGQAFCQPGQLDCNGLCVFSDSNNCGACGQVCAAGQVCNGGVCGCVAGQIPCGATCVDPSLSASNCGACGVQCASGQNCLGGTCSCQPGLINCGTGCISPQSNPANCGACGITCPVTAPYCSLGTCSAQCATGLATCGAACVDLASDPANCGACNIACPAGQSCSAGVCGCPSGQLNCGECVDVLSNPVNCGACGVSCPSGVCSAGQCVVQGTGGTGGIGTGGVMTGGVSTGGVITGGVSTGGEWAAGGTGSTTTGGVASGGVVTGGVATGGTTTGGSSGSNVGDPPGFVRHKSWYGCSWTGIDTTNVGTTVTPKDFLTRASGDPFCVSGTVGPHPAYESVALLGFNIHEDPATANCAYDPAAASSMGPPGVVPTGTGVAVNFVKTSGDATLRVQIQGPNGATDATDRWCYTIDAVQGPIFAPYREFNTKCWAPTTGTNWNGQPVSAVVFLVPGSTQPVPYNYCINGFADGNSVADAPAGGMVAPLLSGRIGGTDAGGTTDPDYKRVKVVGDDGHSYIVQNNNWGVASQSEQTLAYVGNSFDVISSTGWSTGSGVPASFPSVYIGANGNVNDGLTTSSDDGLPKQVSTIQSIQTTYQWSGPTSGDFNASYDVWFAASPPVPGSYDDAISGFVMVWLYKPGGRQPIGSVRRQATIAGRTWDVWVGPRGGSGPNSNAPVVSYTSSSLIPSMTFDLKAFIADAAQHGIQPSWYLTDVFGGFEIWTGRDAVGLSLDKFTCDVN